MLRSTLAVGTASIMQIAGRVVLVPGLAGSSLAVATYAGFSSPVWLDYLRASGPLLELLRLNAQGDGPENPLLVKSVTPTGALEAYYGPIYTFFASRVPTEIFAYDWRLSCVGNAIMLKAFLSQLIQGGPVYVVAHSMGGLIARIAVAQLRTDPNYSNLKRLVCMGTPHFGSWESVKTVASIPSWLQPYAEMFARYGFRRSYSIAISYMVNFLTRFRSVYELFPDAWAGPYSQITSTLDLYNSINWATVNAGVTAQLLNAAAAFKQALPSVLIDGRLINVAGVGTVTTSGLSDINSLQDARAYSSDSNGDGVVPFRCAQLPGVYGIYATVTHQGMLHSPAVMESLFYVLSSGLDHDIVF